MLWVAVAAVGRATLPAASAPWTTGPPAKPRVLRPRVSPAAMGTSATADAATTPSTARPPSRATAHQPRSNT
eukprot:8866932-Pyramimonas_sp.AAC.1